MPVYQKEHKQFYKTRSEVLKKFREEEKQKCYCRVETWAENEQKLTCYNCTRKEGLADELKKKGFWGGLKDLKYWKVRRQGRYKQLEIAPVYPEPQFQGTVTLPEEIVQTFL